MKSMICGLLLLLAGSGSLFAAEFDYADFQRILDQKCSQCHTQLRIEDAMLRGADIDTIIAKMIRFGARLSEQEQEVMGVFWNADNKPQTTAEPASPQDPLREYRAVLQQRCTGCHSLAIVEKALAEGRSIEGIIEDMRKRGAIITPADKKVLGTFWGEPLKVQPE
ncbi:hypothetical protein SAMN02745165_01790 [Malonomonas rubra DSM 5091]|uniref:Cytochrome c domain-containing protein n=1 Tax=Malonomonas rubra DSM 5091 TaxID=1122189 RepID=A0A1M6HDB4_MALRU|nr:hypothetical protein [Malonomonas rubra]SHJ20109.1 hypothetical protein SAMN02745165_01790 [Malonomonas rubra DSM 5091]